MARARIRRSCGAAGLGVVTLLAALVTGSGTAGAAPPVEYYLALGDSIAFGYAPPEVTPPQKYQQPSYFKGYPEYLAPWFGLRDINAACPGETTASFIDMRQPSYTCEETTTSEIGYRDLFPLHRKYGGSQLNYARNFLTRHGGDTKLVTINAGANDIFRCQATTADECTGADFQTTLNAIGQNMDTILSTLRATGYGDKLVVLTYYAVSYTDPIQVAGTQLLNNVLSTVAKKYDAIVANGYSTFKLAAGPDGDPCAAGLLIALPAGGCNVHPTPLGQILLANAIAKAAGAESPIG